MAKNLWKDFDLSYQIHVAISTIDSEDADERVVYMEDLEKRKQVYGICGECKEPGTGEYWCQPCNAKRSKDNFKNWTSGNKDIDEFIQQSQLNALHFYNYIEWVPFEKFQNITYITEGGFGKIYSAEWPEGNIENWDIENQKCSDFLDEVKSYLQIHLFNIVRCFGITQNPNTKEYMMVLMYCENEPVNSSDLTFFQSGSADTNTQSESANPISECLDVQLSELELNEIYQDNKNDIE
ncbi:unnamed protein product [Rhizophagus irregularis]|nr:unnamed protein product [Rhizophagus irregularis]